MKQTIQQLLRPSIAALKPYSSARDEFKGEASVYLDANESPYNEPFNRYPDPYQKILKEKISEIKAVNPLEIFLGNGSDEPIDLLIRAFCTPGSDNIISIDPTYGMYQVAADINNIEVKKVALDSNFDLYADDFLAAADKNSKIAFICSPNNPSGNCLNRNEIVKVIENFDGLVVLDEAYIDFATQPSFIADLKRYNNLIILQTFSKAWGMAGIRLGMAFANKEIIDVLSKIKYPYNINILTQQKALELLEKNNPEKWITTTIIERQRVDSEMQNLKCIVKTYASDANFILAKTNDAAKLYNYLAQKGIVVRNRSSVKNCDNCIRFTIGSPAENDKLLEAMAKYDKTEQL